MKRVAINGEIKDKIRPFFPKVETHSYLSKYNKDTCFIGWGKKKSGIKALILAEKYQSQFLLMEDGFLRSLQLGFENNDFYSVVEDDVGIYYDSMNPSKLENLLNDDNNFVDMNLERVQYNIQYIIQNKLSKYNNNIEKLPESITSNKKKKILLISQVKGDASLKYGEAEDISNDGLLLEILSTYKPENYEYYVKVHPDVISGKKKSNIDLEIFEASGFNILSENYNPIVLLNEFDVIYTYTSQMGFEALMLGKTVICLGNPFYSHWGLTIDKNFVERRNKKRTLEEVFYASYMLYSKYINPLTKKYLEIEEALLLLNKERREFLIDNGVVNLFGFSMWKRNYVSNFINSNTLMFRNNLHIPNTPNDTTNKYFIWGMKFPEIKNSNIVRVEDGFLRSVHLGSDLTKPYSLIFDTKGIYFNSTRESDLENILNNDLNFNPVVNKIGLKIKELINNNKVSKYNIQHKDSFTINTDKKKILVIGQVDEDASIQYSGSDIKNSKELLLKVIEENPDTYIIFKPHPDVLSGNRNSVLDLDNLPKEVNYLSTKESLHHCIDLVDEVHTISSLSGFEALIKGKTVVCYGIPFYSNWGLTIDKKTRQRRKKKRTLEELILATYYIYPRYINPKTNKRSDFFEIFEVIKAEIRIYKYTKFIHDIKRPIIKFFKKIFKGII